MSDPNPDPNDVNREPASFGDLPIQPTGSGVADLVVAYEQMALAGADTGMDAAAPATGIADATPDDAAAIVPTEDGRDAADSAAHPS